MANLISFTFQDNKVRTLIDEQENIWFCRKDILDILGLRLNTKLLNSLNPKGIAKSGPLSTAGGKQQLIFINEPNLYRVIFKSEKPQAKEFQDWVFEEVLPAIRKHGAYVAPHKEDDKSFIETFKNFCLQHNYSAREVEMFNWFGEMKLKQGYAIAMSKVEKEKEEVKEQQPQALPVPYDDVKRILLLAAYLSDRYNRYVNAVAAIRELISSLNIIKEDISDLAYLGDIQMPLLKQKLLDLPFTDEQRKEIEHALRPWAVNAPANNK